MAAAYFFSFCLSFNIWHDSFLSWQDVDQLCHSLGCSLLKVDLIIISWNGYSGKFPCGSLFRVNDSSSLRFVLLPPPLYPPQHRSEVHGSLKMSTSSVKCRCVCSLPSGLVYFSLKPTPQTPCSLLVWERHSYTLTVKFGMDGLSYIHEVLSVILMWPVFYLTCNQDSVTILFPLPLNLLDPPKNSRLPHELYKKIVSHYYN